MKNTYLIINVLLAVALLLLSAKLVINGSNHSESVSSKQSSSTPVVETGKKETIGEITRSFIDPIASSGAIVDALKKGVLLTTKADNNTNMMTIGWGTIGVIWGKTVFVAYVRQSRYTHEMLAKHGEFTVNIDPTGSSSKITDYCGTKSGRDTDKAKDLNLTMVDGSKVGVPAILELPLTLECKVLYTQDQKRELLPKDIQDKMYPTSEKAPDGDVHTMYYAEIVGAYLLKKGL